MFESVTRNIYEMNWKSLVTYMALLLPGFAEIV
jgi:hypothetical protein